VILWKQYSGRNFSGFFQCFPPGSCQKAKEAGRNPPEKSEKFPVGVLLPCSSDFRCFPEGYGDFPVSFLQDPVVGVIDLGNSTVFITEEERTRNTLQNGDFSYPLFWTFQITTTDPNTQDKIIIYKRKISIQ
jgi:hypothetical protein